MTIPRYLLFTAGQIGMMSLARFFFQWIVKFAATPEIADDPTSKVLFAGTALGGLLLAFRLFDGVTDPLAGTLSDRWVRSGKQRRWLLWFSFAGPPVGLAICFLPAHSMPESLRWTIVGLGMLAFFIGYTFYAIPYWSLVDDYAGDDVRTRRILSNLLGAGLLLATAVGFVVSGILIDKFGYANAALLFAVAALALMPLPFFAAPENARRPGASVAGHAPSLWQGMGIALRHRRFLALIALFAGSQMSFTIMTSAAPFISEDLLAGSERDVGKILGPLLGTGIVCFVFVPAVSRRLGWQLGMLAGSIGLAPVYICSGVLGASVIGSPMLTAGILFAFGGPMIAMLLGLEGEGVVDCALEHGGSDTVSIYWGVFNFIVKALNGLAIFIASWLSELRGSLNAAQAEELGHDVEVFAKMLQEGTIVGAGTIAVRWMSFAAGGCLLLGVAVYFVIRPRRRPTGQAQ